MKAVEARGLNGTQNRKEDDLFRLELNGKTLEAAPLKVFNDAHMLHPDLI